MENVKSSEEDTQNVSDGEATAEKTIEALSRFFRVNVLFRRGTRSQLAD